MHRNVPGAGLKDSRCACRAALLRGWIQSWSWAAAHPGLTHLCRVGAARRLLNDCYPRLEDAPANVALVWLALAVSTLDRCSAGEYSGQLAAPAAGNLHHSISSCNTSLHHFTAACRWTASMQMRPNRPCLRCCPAASQVAKQVSGSEGVGQTAGRRGGVGVGVWAVLPRDVLQANTTPKGCPPGSLLSSPLCLGSAHLPAGWSQQQYLALLHLYVFEALLPKRHDAAGAEPGGCCWDGMCAS